MKRLIDQPSLGRGACLVERQYDALGRRIRQTTWDGSSGAWQVTEDLTFASDPVLFGRPVAELNATNNALVRAYAWGLDLSGSMQGAGGVGGLLSVTVPTGPNTGAYLCCYDGNGNVLALVRAADGTRSAVYEYGPFGELLRASGAVGMENPFQFSTKRREAATALVLYEYRVYAPELGRWLSRDPIGEKGHQVLTQTRSGRSHLEEEKALYGFVANDPLYYIDTDGRFTASKCPSCGKWYQGFHKCPPPPPAVNPCDGYKKFIPTPKCMCNCKYIADPYPANAEKVCNGFMKKYEWSEDAQCVARCLVKVEQATHRLKWCSVRATVRLAAHVACYAECGFFPWEGLPPGGVGVGAGDLLWTLAKCRDPWDQAQ